jgi:hypothetical protein
MYPAGTAPEEGGRIRRNAAPLHRHLTRNHHHPQPRQTGADLKEKTMTDHMIKVSLTQACRWTRWKCHVCGGRTEKDEILAEGKQDLPNNEYRIVRVCDQCLRGADGLWIDKRLESYARFLDTEAEITRALIGRLEVPTFAEWKAVQGEMIEI